VLGPTLPTLPQEFRSRVYATAGFVANNAFVLPERGLARGFDVFDVYDTKTIFARTTFGRNLLQVLRGANIGTRQFRTTSDVVAQFTAWRESLGERPCLALLNVMTAHEPYDCGGHRPDLRIWDRREHRTPAENQLLAEA
jgi:hypothetical protein